jgi:7-carboxy-7-deazaguanine synthase
MAYKVKEMFYTLQGEGAQSGRPAVFCRFSGCNLWTGREKDRHKAICQFCDTDFWGTDGLNGGKYTTAKALVQRAAELWGDMKNGQPYVVCTGGEPALQLDATLVAAFHAAGFEIAIETNGTVALAQGIDWVCVSPKAHTEIVVTEGHELKLVYPQADAEPARYAHLAFQNFYLQPMDGLEKQNHTRLTVAFCMENPQWKLSLQTHKLLGIP